MGYGTELTVEEQAKIDAYVDAGLTRNRIARKLSRAPKTVGSYIRNPLRRTVRNCVPVARANCRKETLAKLCETRAKEAKNVVVCVGPRL